MGCPNNHKYSEEKLRELKLPELFILEARKMHEGWCETADFDALVQEILDCYYYAMETFKKCPPVSKDPAAQ